MGSAGDSVQGSLASLLDTSLQLAPVAMVAADEHGRLLTANAQWRTLTGIPAERQDPDDWMEPLERSSRRRFVEAMERTRTNGRSESIDLELIGPAGRRWTRWWLHRREVGETPVLMIAAVDVHDDLAQRDDLRELATRDDLTGLLNRRFFLETVDQALRRAERFPEPAGVLYIDLDGFKAVNDLGGHTIGDRVLATVAARLRLAVRSADVVARIGGDEFSVLIERLTSPNEATAVAARIEEALNQSVEVAGERWPMSASIGVAISSGMGETALGLVGRADEAMYAAKRARAKEAARPPPPAASARSPVPVQVIDVRALQVGMETIRRSLEALLSSVDIEPD